MIVVTLTLRTDDTNAAQKAARTLSTSMIKLVNDGASDVDVRVSAYDDDEDDDTTTEDTAEDSSTTEEDTTEEPSEEDDEAL